MSKPSTTKKSSAPTSASNEFDKGVEEGYRQAKEKTLNTLRTHATNLFLEEQDDLAKEVRRVFLTLKQL